ncbi:MAG TPA: hypothetical protein VFK04_14410 [Gemmatimonadaceae bacterium]|nr:hypothetical protein [Gemmatimonadaceae bacterium]
MTRAYPVTKDRAQPEKRRPWWALASGYIACVWAILFAFANIYLQLGGPGLTGVSHDFRGGAMALNLGVVPIKLLAALVALGLVQPWGERLSPRLRRLLLIAAWSGCAILVGYPVIGMSLTAAVQSGLLAAPPTGFKVGGGFQTRVLLYGTFFLIPGILYAIAAWDYRRATSRDPVAS